MIETRGKNKVLRLLNARSRRGIGLSSSHLLGRKQSYEKALAAVSGCARFQGTRINGRVGKEESGKGPNPCADYKGRLCFSQAAAGKKANKITKFKDFYSFQARLLGTQAFRGATGCRVLSQAEGILNVLNSRGLVHSIVLKEKALSPFAVLLEGRDFPTFEHETPIEVFRREGQLLLETRTLSLRLDLGGAKRWSGKIAGKARKAFAKKNAAGIPGLTGANSYAPEVRLETILREAGAAEGLLGLLPEARPSPTSGFARKLLGPDSLSGGAADRTAAPRLGLLVGLGPGLTPSGDDFIAGFLFARNLSGRPPEKDLEVAVRSRLHATTPAGRTLLSGALAAAFPRYLHEFLEAWTRAENPGAEKAAVKAVLAHGSSSGTDALTGFLFGLA